MYESAIKLIEKYDEIIIHRHSRPDGDAVGSQAGLAAVIRENYPGKKVLCAGDPAGRYSFIPLNIHGLSVYCSTARRRLS